MSDEYETKAVHDPERALLVAVSLAELEAGMRTAADEDRAAFIVAGSGDLDDYAPGGPVLFFASEAGVARVPAVTWRARFVSALPLFVPEPGPAEADQPDTDEDVDGPEPRAVIEVDALERLDKADWIHTNELVPKRERRARFFAPHRPTLVRLPD